MTSKTLSACAVAVGAGAVFLGLMAAAGPEHAGAPVRIGVYDNRAIAIAWGGTEFNPVHEMKREYERAKKAGDEARMAELEAWGVSTQRKLHFQGFGRYPVDDLLAPVADRLPEVAAEHDLDAIAWFCDYQGEGVVTVDITVDLVKLFNPDERTLMMAEQIGGVEPVDFETLVNMDCDD